MKTITKKDFDKEVIKNKKKTVIEFYAPWCEYCTQMANILDEIKKSYKNIEFYKINTDDESQLTSEHAVMSIPTIIYFKDGNVMSRTIGTKSKEEIEKDICNLFF